MNWKGKIAVAVAFLNIILLVQPAVATNDPPAGGGTITGNWTVTDNRTYSSVNIFIDHGNLVILANASLTLDRVNLHFISDWNGQFQLEVRNGGTLNIINGSRVVSTNPDRHYYFRARAGSNLLLANSTFNQVGVYWNNAPAENAGVYIASSNASVDSCQFSDVSHGVYLAGVNTPVINNIFRQFQYTAITTVSSNARIYGNNISYVLASPWPTGISVNRGAPKIENNSLMSMYIGVYCYDTAADIRNNYFNDVYLDVYSYYASPNITDNVITNGYYGLYTLTRSSPLVANNSISNNQYFGMYISDQCRPVIRDNNFFRCGWNYYGGYGVAIYLNDHSGGPVTNNTIYTPNGGLGIQIEGSSDPVVEKCNINTTDRQAMNVNNLARPQISDCTIYSRNDPAFVADQNSGPTVDRCSITSAAAPNANWDPALAAYNYASVRFSNCTIVQPSYLGLYLDHYPSVLLDNCTVTSWDNAVYITDFASFSARNTRFVSGNNVGLYARDSSTARLDSCNVTSRNVGVMCDWQEARVDLINTTVASTSGGALTVDWGSANIEGSTLTSVNSACLYAWGGGIVNAVNSTIRSSFQQDVYLDTGGNNRFTFTNVSFDPFKVRFTEPTSVLNVSWYLSITVQWQNGIPVRDADINVKNVTGATLFNASSGVKGECSWNTVQEYRRTQTSWENYTSHDITAQSSGLKKTERTSLRANRDVHVTLTDADAPSITITSPDNGQIFNSSDIAVEGTAYDGGSGLRKVEYSVDGGNWTAPEGMENWTARLSLGDGTHAIKARAFDIAGKSLETGVTIQIDTYIALELAGPAEQALLNSSRVRVTGTADPLANVTLNGVRIALEQDGSFSTTIELADGQHIITLTAVDDAGNRMVITRNIRVDTVPPPLSLLTPSDGTATGSRFVQFFGATEPGARVWIGSTPILVEQNGSFSAVLTLPEGSNSLTVKAQDAAGNTNNLTVIVTVDTIPPVLRILTPEDNLLTNNPSVTITGETDGISVSVGSVHSTVITGHFTADVTLSEGVNTITALAVDALGNSRTASITISLDTRPPDLFIVHPPTGHVTNNATTIVSVVTEFGSNVTVNGIPASQQNGVFSATILLNPGENIIAVRATDRANNWASQNRSVLLDQVPPPLSISAPSSGYRTQSGKLTVRGATESGSTVTVNGVGARVDGTGAFTVEISITEGDNSLVITAVDPAGNPTTRMQKVTRTGALAISRDETPMILMGILIGLLAGVVVGLVAGRRRKPEQVAPEEPDRPVSYDEPATPHAPPAAASKSYAQKTQTRVEREPETRTGPAPAGPDRQDAAQDISKSPAEEPVAPGVPAPEAVMAAEPFAEPKPVSSPEEPDLAPAPDAQPGPITQEKKTEPDRNFDNSIEDILRKLQS